MNPQFIAQALQIMGMLPLLAYPAVLVANAMQLSALRESSRRASGSSGKDGLLGLFVGGTTVYPLVLLACRALANRDNHAGELAWSAGPLVFLGGLWALFSFLARGQSEE